MRVKLLLLAFSLFFITFIIPCNAQTVSISNLRYTNGAAIPQGSSIEIYEGATTSVTFDLNISNPQLVLKKGYLYVYSKKIYSSSTLIQYAVVDFNNDLLSTWYSKEFTVVLNANSFNTTGGTFFAEFSNYSSGGVVTGNTTPVKLIPTPALNNNTISISGENVTGSLPTGGTGNYTYRWLAYVLDGEDPVVIEQTTKDCTIPASVYQFMSNIGAANAQIVREVRSGNKVSVSNVVLALPTQEIVNNTISISGQNIIGSLPTGGTGSYKYEYYVYNEFPDGEIVDGVTMVGSNQNYTGIVQGYLTTKYYRRVVSGNKVSVSNTVTIPPLPSFAKKASVNAEITSTELIVYPNPTSESVNFSTNFSTNKEIEILIYSENLGNQKSVFKSIVTPNQVVNWNVPSNYAKGIYFYKILSDNREVKTGKIIFK